MEDNKKNTSENFRQRLKELLILSTRREELNKEITFYDKLVKWFLGAGILVFILLILKIYFI